MNQDPNLIDEDLPPEEEPEQNPEPQPTPPDDELTIPEKLRGATPEETLRKALRAYQEVEAAHTRTAQESARKDFMLQQYQEVFEQVRQQQAPVRPAAEPDELPDEEMITGKQAKSFLTRELRKAISEELAPVRQQLADTGALTAQSMIEKDADYAVLKDDFEAQARLLPPDQRGNPQVVRSLYNMVKGSNFDKVLEHRTKARPQPQPPPDTTHLGRVTGRSGAAPSRQPAKIAPDTLAASSRIAGEITPEEAAKWSDPAFQGEESK